MITLNKLVQKFPTNYLINRYVKQTNETWTKGKYYLGGQVPLNIDDEITGDIMYDVHHRTFIQARDIANSWEMASVQRAETDFLEFQDLVNTYKRIVKYNGILRALVFWIIPARKRATEKIWHPNNLCIIGDELVIKK